MQAEIFRHFFDYHFSENRNLWETHIVPLTQEQFTQKAGYSVGSVRNQVVHLMLVDDSWFRALRGVEIPKSRNPVHFPNRQIIRAQWDQVELEMREYLAELSDEQLFSRPLEGEDRELAVWQVLLHVVNHGTDHRAQILRMLNDLGRKTGPQDYIFYVYDHPQ